MLLLHNECLFILRQEQTFEDNHIKEEISFWDREADLSKLLINVRLICPHSAGKGKSLCTNNSSRCNERCIHSLYMCSVQGGRPDHFRYQKEAPQVWQIVGAPDGQTHSPIKVDSMFPAGVFGPCYSRPLLHSFGAF